MPSEILPWLASLTAGLVSFLAAADAHTVILIVFLTYLAQGTLWKRAALWPEAIIWMPLVLAFILTPIMSTAAESQWGGRWYYRAVMYNGGVGMLLWRVALPQLKKKWPQIFDPTGEKPDGPENLS